MECLTVIWLFFNRKFIRRFRAQDTLVIEFSSTIHFWWMEFSITSNKYLKKRPVSSISNELKNWSIDPEAMTNLESIHCYFWHSKVKFKLFIQAKNIKFDSGILMRQISWIWKYSAFQIFLNKCDVYIKTEQIQYSD